MSLKIKFTFLLCVLVSELSRMRFRAFRAGSELYYIVLDPQQKFNDFENYIWLYFFLPVGGFNFQPKGSPASPQEEEVVVGEFAVARAAAIDRYSTAPRRSSPPCPAKTTVIMRLCGRRRMGRIMQQTNPGQSGQPSPGRAANGR